MLQVLNYFLNVDSEPYGEGIPYDDMKFVQPAFSKGKIDRAGKALISLGKDDPGRDEAITVVDNWRSCHAYPLQNIKMTPLNRAKNIDTKAIIAQRLKRRPSIEIKLRDNPNMKLSQMQDIGGCRAILRNISQVNKLVRKYKEYHAKNPNAQDRSCWDGSDDSDYIKNPKKDGYRSVHLIFRYRSGSGELQCFNGQRIEIQIRSRLQHLWATAVETAQIFTGQALKSKIKNASERWLRFFCLTSGAFAIREKCPIVPCIPDNREGIISELRSLLENENILSILQGWNQTIHLLQGPRLHAESFLLVLDPIKRTLNITSFEDADLKIAQQEYDRAEKKTEGDPNIQIVLASVDKLEMLPRAYPNYYVDTIDFINEIEREVNQAKKK